MIGRAQTALARTVLCIGFTVTNVCFLAYNILYL